MDWDQIREMADEGIGFGAHTLTHPNLAKISIEEAMQQIGDAKALIEEKLGREVEFFAYPYGRHTEAIRRFVGDRFSGTCSTQLDYVSLVSEVFSLPRIEMYYFSRNNLFSLLGTRSFSYYIKWRSMLRSMRVAVTWC